MAVVRYLLAGVLFVAALPAAWLALFSLSAGSFTATLVIGLITAVLVGTGIVLVKTGGRSGHA